MSGWNSGMDKFLTHAYNFFRPSGSPVSWERVVWEKWSLPKHCFILWLAVQRKLRTRDRLPFLPSDPFYVFYQYEEESYDHLFFACEWTSCLWGKIKSWLRNGRNMTTLYSALRGLRFRKSNLEARMRRVSLGIGVYLISEERNKRIFEGKCLGVDRVFRRFQILFYTILHFHVADHSRLDVS